MTDKIDLDELDEESTGTDGANRGDWFWRGEDAPDEAAGAWGPPDGNDASSDPAGPAGGDDTPDAATDETGDRSVPHVPRERRDQPVGIPKASGGAGAGSTPDRDGGVPNEAPSGADPAAERGDDGGAASGPHGGGTDDMTMALTYRASKRLADPARAIADAGQWADWVGIVGEVDAHVINKFQRDHAIDADFFNGTGTGPGERLRGIGEHSMFYAERMVVVGVAGADERIAAEADWEFVPVTEAAEKAGWELDESDGT